MTQIPRDTILKLASLSSLQLTDEEVTELQSDVERIIGYVEQLDELDTEDVQPAYQVTGLQNVYRDDVVEHDESMREKLLSLAPSSQDDQIKVPKVL